MGSTFSRAWHLIKAKQILSIIITILISPRDVYSPYPSPPIGMCVYACVHIHTKKYSDATLPYFLSAMPLNIT